MKTMKLFLVAVIIGAGIGQASYAGPKKAKTPEAAPVQTETNYATAEPWKGTPYSPEFTAGLMMGLGVIDNTAGFNIPVSIARKILHEGFVPEINDQVFLEVQAGPYFASNSSAMTYSLHLRWDFHKNYLWSFYALSGFGGAIADGMFRFHPRVGMGAFWHVFEKVSFRSEFSHEFVGIGISLML